MRPALTAEDEAWICLEVARRDLERRMRSLGPLQRRMAKLLDQVEAKRAEITAAMDLVEECARELARVRDGRRAA